MNIRKIDLPRDTRILLDFHVVINYTSGSPALRKAFTFDQFREKEL
jgi:hypothetical protein